MVLSSLQRFSSSAVFLCCRTISTHGNLPALMRPSNYYQTAEIAKLSKCSTKWKPIEAPKRVRNSVFSKFQETNFCMTRLCNFLENPSKLRLKQLLSVQTRLAAKYDITANAPKARLKHDILTASLGGAQISPLQKITGRVFHSFLSLVLWKPNIDHSNTLIRVMNWSSRNQQNVKVGERILSSVLKQLKEKEADKKK